MKKIKSGIIFLASILLLSFIAGSCFKNQEEIPVISEIQPVISESIKKPKVSFQNPEESSNQEALQAGANQYINITAENAVVFDISSDKILYMKGSFEDIIYPASITKLFTAFVALQYLSPDMVITVGNEVKLVKEGSSLAYINKNQKLTVEMLVEAMLLPSGNDAAYILSVAAGRKITGNDNLSINKALSVFIMEMNKKSEMLSLKNTHFTSPDGYHDPEHYTSLADIVKIAEYALGNSTIAKYVKLQRDSVVYVSGQTNNWTNTNLLLDPSSKYYCKDAVGLKTGYTVEAGNCLLSAFENENSVYVIGVFNCADKNSRFSDAIKLYNSVCK